MDEISTNDHPFRQSTLFGMPLRSSLEIPAPSIGP